MPGIGPLEIAIVAIIVLIIFGPKRLPELGRSLGSGMRNFKNSVTGKDSDDEPRELAEPRGEGAPGTRSGGEDAARARATGEAAPIAPGEDRAPAAGGRGDAG